MSEIMLTIAFCAVITIAIRALPIVFLSRLDMPGVVRDWLGFIPSGIMAAIITAELVKQQDPELFSSGLGVGSIAAILSMLAGILTRSLFITVLVGVVSYLVLISFFVDAVPGH